METPATKKDRFQRLAQKRTTEVLKKLDILGHCANRGSYDYSREEVTQMFLAIERKLNDVKTRFKFSGDEAFHF